MQFYDIILLIPILDIELSIEKYFYSSKRSKDKKIDLTAGDY